jgi:hypothetical protein
MELLVRTMENIWSWAWQHQSQAPRCFMLRLNLEIDLIMSLAEASRSQSDLAPIYMYFGSLACDCTRFCRVGRVAPAAWSMPGFIWKLFPYALEHLNCRGPCPCPMDKSSFDFAESSQHELQFKIFAEELQTWGKCCPLCWRYSKDLQNIFAHYTLS